jgi:CDP-paratose 2-epimerase
VSVLPVIELSTRYDLPAAHPFYEGIDESMSIDQSTHSIFGVSKAASDLMAQEYGRQFGLKVAVFRPVTITGPAHRGSKLHGYLSHLVKCLVTGEEYVINGFKGKQVRDNIHVSDLISAFYKVYLNPKDCFGEVYNIGAGRFSHNSIVEAIEKVESIVGRKGNVRYSDIPRHSDWKWCIFSTEKFRRANPGWRPLYDNDKLLNELCSAWQRRRDSGIVRWIDATKATVNQSEEFAA